MVKLITTIVIWIIVTNFIINASVIGRKLIHKSRPNPCNEMIAIITSCYGEQVKSIIVFGNDNIHKYYNPSFLNAKLFSTIIINNNYTAQRDDYHNYISKSDMFILPAATLNNLKSMILILKSTRWWNNQALFSVLGISTVNANEALKIMWKMNILTALVICKSNNNNSIKIFTHNPFTNRAPYPWQRVHDNSESNSRWNIYSQQYNEDENFCESLKFDKTKFLDGYKVRAVASPRASTNIKIKKNKAYNLTNLMEIEEYEHAIYFTNVLKELNVSTSICFDEVGYWDNKTAKGFLKPLNDGKYDIALHSRGIRFSYNLTTTYPLRMGGAGVLTQYRKFLTPYEKILRFYSIGIVLLTNLSLFISFIVMLIYKKRGTASAFFEILRLTLTTGFMQTIDRQSVRIYFFGIFILILILNATFTSKLSAFLTQPERRYVTTINDLLELDYDVYVPQYVANKRFDWTHGEIKKLYITPGDSCFENVVNYNTKACVGPMARMAPLAIKYRLDLSYTIINDEYLVYWARHEWPLINRLDIISLNLMEGGFLEYWRQQALVIPLHKLNITEADATVSKYRPIDIQDLIFAFYLLAMGLACSMTAFISEILWINLFQQIHFIK